MCAVLRRYVRRPKALCAPSQGAMCAVPRRYVRRIAFIVSRERQKQLHSLFHFILTLVLSLFCDALLHPVGEDEEPDFVQRLSGGG